MNNMTNITPKDAETIMNEWWERRNSTDGHSAWFRSSLASILLQAKERMPEKSNLNTNFDTENLTTMRISGRLEGYNVALDDCRAVLDEMVEEIMKKL